MIIAHQIHAVRGTYAIKVNAKDGRLRTGWTGETSLFAHKDGKEGRYSGTPVGSNFVEEFDPTSV